MTKHFDPAPVAAQTSPAAAGLPGGIASLGALPRQSALTPAGLQETRVLARRRLAVAALNIASIALLGWGVATALAAGGWSVADTVLFAAVLVGAPWTVMGMWNALLGLWLLHLRRDGLAAVAPYLPAGDAPGPLTTRTALAMTVRNEAPERAFRRLAAMRRALDETGHGAQFDIHVLSDTSDPETAEAEERLFHAMRAELGGARAQYRRRIVNTGWKAGNVREFLLEQGRGYDLYLPLDADSYMGAATIVRMVRIMEAYPRIGILQSLTTGMPSASLFTRALTFGARVSTRPYLMGASWWHGDTGFYWGHNALIRVRPFVRHCRLPVLPGRPPLGGHILSHDLPEAALMRRAGWECRVLPVETESWEENPPTLPDFIRRDLRWCNGNMQATRLQTMRGMTPLSRFHLFTAAAMYFGSPAWMVMMLAVLWKLVSGEGGVDVAIGTVMFFGMLTVALAPKLVGLLDTALTPGRTAAFGGGARLAASAATEFVLSTLMAPIVAFQVTLFLVGLAFGGRIPWTGQNRDAYRVEWRDAARGLWPQTVFGFALLATALAWGSPVTLAWAAPVLLGLCLAVPYAVATATLTLGGWAERRVLCASPEEIALPRTLPRFAEPELPAIPLEPLRAA